MTRYLESAAARNEEDASARVLESGAADGGGTITETWTGANNDPWPSPPWTITNPVGGTITNLITSNRGQLAASGVSYTLALAQLAGSTHTDLDVTFVVNILSTSERYIETFYRMGALSGGFPASCYCLDISPSGNEINLQTVDAGGSATTIANVPSAGVNVVVDINFRIHVIGSNHKVRWWTGTEPGTWQIDVNDSTFTEGSFALGVYCGFSTAVVGAQYDNLTLQALTPTPPAVVKGVGSVSRDNLSAELDLVDVSWYYDWASYSTGGMPVVPSTPGIQYVPMMWGDWDRTYAGFDVGGTPAESIGPSNILTGFNEPNIPEQADMTVARCRALWPDLEATGARLGSPVMSPNAGAEAYLDAFMANTSGYQPRVDFICAHWYTEYDGGFTDIGGYLDYLHTRYGKPLWLTEVGTLSGGQAANASLMTTVFAALATRPWVERIAWYALQPNGWANTELVTATPTLTTSGTQYATYPAGTVPPEAEPLVGTAAGLSTTTGALSVARPLAGTAAGLSSTTGAMAVARALAGTAGGLSTTTGAMAVGRALVGTSGGVSTDSGVMIVARALAGTSTGQSTATGDLAGSSAKTLDGSAAGLSTTTGALSVARGLVGTSDGLSTAGATAMVAQRALVGSTGGLSTTTGALARAVPLAGSTDGTSAASATTLATAGLPGGMSNGESTTTGVLSVARALVGTSAGASTTTGAVARAVPVAGSAAGLSTTTGALTVARTLVGSASGVSTAGGTSLTVARALVGSTGGVATTSGSLLATAAGGLSGFTAGSSTATGALSVARPLAGTSGGVGATTGALVKAIPLASTSAVGGGSATGVIARGVALTATANGTSDAVGDTRVARSLVGSSDGLSTANASLVLASRLAGSSSGTSDAIGTLQAIRIETIFGLWDGHTFEAMQWGDQQVVDFLIIPS